MDIFRGRPATRINLKGVDRVIVCTALEDKAGGVLGISTGALSAEVMRQSKSNCSPHAVQYQSNTHPLSAYLRIDTGQSAYKTIYTESRYSDGLV